MKIQLPDFIIADLYKDTLVTANDAQENTLVISAGKFTETPAVSAKTEEQKLEKEWVLGDNKKNILILVNDADAVFINDEMLATLNKLLEALKMNLLDIAIVNFHHHPKKFTSLKEQLQPAYIFMFDVNTKDLELPFIMPAYQIQQYNNCTFLIASSLALSAGNDDVVKKEKRKLWENLKKIFTA